MVLHLTIPASVELGRVRDLASKLSVSKAYEIEFTDGSVVSHPMICCILASLEANYGMPALTCDGAPILPEASPYLTKMKVFGRSRIQIEPEALTPEAIGMFIPVSHIENNRDLTNFILQLVPLLHASPEESNALKYVLSELIRNVIEHAGSRTGAFAAAEVDGNGVIKVGVADAGIGILSSIRRSHAADGEQSAIKLALSPGISGATPHFGGNEQNGGAGLFFMKAIASLAQQHMVVLSGRTIMTVMPQTVGRPAILDHLDDDEVFWQELEAAVAGTAVGVDFQLRDSVAFRNLLTEIGAIYRQRVRSGTQARRKARFT